MAFVDDLDRPVLDDDDHHHLARVRRIRDGEEVLLSDGRGAWRRATMDGRRPVPVGARHRCSRPRPEVGVGFALTKGHKPEQVVQKLTELGVDRIVPFVAARSVVRWDGAKVAANHERWLRVAREAAMQSRRAWIPTVETVSTYDEVAVRPGSARADVGVAAAAPTVMTPLVLVGPEGGWDDSERRPGQVVVSLADAVLRAETAAVVAGVLLVHARSWPVTEVWSRAYRRHVEEEGPTDAQM